MKSNETNNSKQEEVNVNDENQDLSTGIVKKLVGETSSSSSDSDSDTDLSIYKKDNLISLTKDVLPFIIPLICFLTIKDNNKDLMLMLLSIKNNPSLMDIFDEQNMIWWNKKIFIDVIEKLIKNNIKENSSIYNSTILIKMTIKSLIDKPEELLKFIQECLKPKDIEKKKYGEVFTPIKLVDEMLDKLPSEVWINPELKWLDPANGMGNFPITIYYRLMDGLKEVISNTNQRKKHILENMLYMSELNKKNCFITKQIFDINNEYNLNIYEGNSLEMDTKELWNIEKFDIIVGNPPYQKNFENNNGRVGGSSLWSEFINKFIDKLNDDKYLLFITPCSWMTGGSNKQSGNILNGIMKKYTLLHLNIEECSKYFNVGSTFSYYLIKKSNDNINFDCIVKYNKKVYNSVIKQEDFKKLKVIPKLLTNETISIINKFETVGTDKFNFLRLYDLDIRQKKRYSLNGKYNVRHKVVDIRKTDWEQECINKNKILISMPGYLKATFDYSCACSDATLFMYVKDEEYGNYLINLLNSKYYQYIINNYRELTGLNNHKNINRLSICPENKNINDYFKLSIEEINFLDSIYDKKIIDDKSVSSKSSKKSKEDKICCNAIIKSTGLKCCNEAKYGEFCGRHKPKNIKLDSKDN